MIDTSKALIITGVVILGIFMTFAMQSRTTTENDNFPLTSTAKTDNGKSNAELIPERSDSMATVESSPFAIAPTQQDIETDEPPSSPQAHTSNQSQLDTAPALRTESVQAPNRYPVSEAEKYFVPAEQRRPGNLGGPPPLPSSNTLSNPALPPDGGFTPPEISRQ